MAITRVSGKNTIKHYHHRSPPSSQTHNLLMNVIAGGIVEGADYLGVRLSGFTVKAYSPNPGGSITFGLGAFIHAGPGSSGDYRGISVEETDDVVLDGADVATGTALTLWGWVNDSSISGANENAFYRVTATSSPPVPHAVPLSSTVDGDVAGAYHWVPQGGAGLLEQSARIDAIIDAGGSPRDFHHIALNYHAVRSEYHVMTWCDFGAVDGRLGMWIPSAGDATKFDTDNRQLKMGTTIVVSMPFVSSAFEVTGSPGVYRSLASVRAVWSELDMDGNEPLPTPKYDSVISVLDTAGSPIMSFSGTADFDVDKPISPLYSLAPPNKISVRIQPANAANRVFMRMVLLGRLV